MGASCVLFALAKPDASYWSYGFPAIMLVVFGSDSVYAAGTIYVAKASKAHEQSVSGAIFNTMTQVCGLTMVL